VDASVYETYKMPPEQAILDTHRCESGRLEWWVAAAECLHTKINLLEKSLYPATQIDS